MILQYKLNCLHLFQIGPTTSPRTKGVFVIRRRNIGRKVEAEIIDINTKLLRGFSVNAVINIIIPRIQIIRQYTNCIIGEFSDLSQISLKELLISSFDFNNVSEVQLPDTLRTLHLPDCKNVLKCSNKTFNGLVSLNLSRNELTEKEILMILGMCPILEYLYLDDSYFNENDEFIFEVPNIEKLHYIGKESSAYN